MFRRLNEELGSARILKCPSDREAIAHTNVNKVQNGNVSYFVNAELKEQRASALLAGDRNLETNGVAVPRGSRVALGMHLQPGWTADLHKRQGNVLLGDGSVHMFKSETFPQALERLGTNVILVP